MPEKASRRSSPIDVTVETITENSAWRPEDAIDLDSYLQDLPYLFEALASSLANVAQRLGGEFPVDPAARKYLQNVATTVASMGQLAGEAHGIHRVARAREVERIENPSSIEGAVLHQEVGQSVVSVAVEFRGRGVVLSYATVPAAGAEGERPTEQPDPNMPDLVTFRYGGGRGKEGGLDYTEYSRELAESSQRIIREYVNAVTSPLGVSLEVEELDLLLMLAVGGTTERFRRGKHLDDKGVQAISAHLREKMQVPTLAAAVYKGLSQDYIGVREDGEPRPEAVLTPDQYLHLYLGGIGIRAAQAGKLVGVKTPTVNSHRYAAINALGVKGLPLAITQAFRIGLYKPLRPQSDR